MTLIRIRCLAVGALATGALAGTARVLVGSLGRPSGPDPAAAVITELCTLALLAGLAWGWLGVLAGVAEAWRGSAAASRETAPRPVGVRRWTLAACGVALTGVALAAPGAGAATPETPVPSSTVVVRPGDCLWSLAAAEVQPGAGPATVTARWRAIYRANRGVIGDDPDLIHPGQRLRLPR